MSRPNRRRILMVGTALETQGGVSAVVGVLKAGGLFERCNVEYIASHCDGGVAAKLRAALRGWLRCMARLFGGRTALLHVHMASRASFWRKLAFILPALALRVPVIVHLHGAEFRQFHAEESSAVVRQLIRFVFERANRVIVLSGSWKDWATAVFPAARVVSIYNPVALPAAVPYEARETSTLLFLGRLGVRKGAFDLIDVAGRLKQRIPNLRVLMGGDGDIQGARKHAERACVAAQVELRGWVCGAEKRALLEQAAVYVLPSYNEGLPMSVLEAMAAGLPVVATPVGGIPEAVTDGVEGFLVKPGDIDALTERLGRLLEDPALRQRMGAAARQKVERAFSVERILPQIEAIYADIPQPPPVLNPGNN